MGSRTPTQKIADRLALVFGALWSLILVGCFLLHEPVVLGWHALVGESEQRPVAHQEKKPPWEATRPNLAALKIASTATVPAPVAGGSLAAIETEIHRRVNEIRAAAQLGRLEADEELAQTGRLHGVDMDKRGFFHHTTPDGLTPIDRIRLHHRRLFAGTAANLFKLEGVGTIPGREAVVAGEVVTGWMNSPRHRRNILRPQFTREGIGVHLLSDTMFVVQVFANAMAELDTSLPTEIAADQELALRGRYLAAGIEPNGSSIEFEDLRTGQRPFALPVQSAQGGAQRFEARGTPALAPGRYGLLLKAVERVQATPEVTHYRTAPGPFVEVR